MGKIDKEAEVAKLKSKVLELQQLLDEQQERNASLSKSLGEIQSSNSDLQNQISIAITEETASKKRLEELSNESSELSNEVQYLEKEKANLLSEISLAEETLEAEEKRVVEIESNLQAVLLDLEKESELAQHEIQANILEQQQILKALQADMSELKDMLATKEALVTQGTILRNQLISIKCLPLHTQYMKIKQESKFAIQTLQDTLVELQVKRKNLTTEIQHLSLERAKLSESLALLISRRAELQEGLLVEKQNLAIDAIQSSIHEAQIARREYPSMTKGASTLGDSTSSRNQPQQSFYANAASKAAQELRNLILNSAPDAPVANSLDSTLSRRAGNGDQVDPSKAISDMEKLLQSLHAITDGKSRR
jgi:chromosome segregation ATPase